jgi:glucose/arabinose dehydrogenase
VRSLPTLFLVLLVLLLLACAPAAPTPADPSPKQGAQPTAQRKPSGSSRPPGGNPGPTPIPRPLVGGIKTELVADGLQLPANLIFAPDGRLFLTEVSLGRVRVIDRGSLQAEPFVQIEQLAQRPEMGLLGLTLDPDFDRNRYLYLYYSQAEGDKPVRNRVVRFTEVGGRGTDMQVVLDNLPIADWKFNAGHNGGRLAFGPDGKLYVTVGDVGVGKSSQDRGKLSGKLLRINPDGSVPADNPVPGSPIYALGLRNVWGMAFHPLSGIPYVTENGDKGHDEVNRIQPGGNFGAPDAQGVVRDPRFLDPFWENYAEGGGISGMTFYTGDLFPEYKNDLLFCLWNGARLTRLQLAGPDYDQVVHEELLSDQCHLDVATGPEGAIYISSVTKVQRLVPAR